MFVAVGVTVWGEVVLVSVKKDWSVWEWVVLNVMFVGWVWFSMEKVGRWSVQIYSVVLISIEYQSKAIETIDRSEY